MKTDFKQKITKMKDVSWLTLFASVQLVCSPAHEFASEVKQKLLKA